MFYGVGSCISASHFAYSVRSSFGIFPVYTVCNAVCTPAHEGITFPHMDGAGIVAPLFHLQLFCSVRHYFPAVRYVLYVHTDTDHQNLSAFGLSGLWLWRDVSFELPVLPV